MKTTYALALAVLLAPLASPSIAKTFTFTCSGGISAVKLKTSSENLEVRIGSQDVETYGNYKQSGSKMIRSS
jgi:hypothetical protein